MTGEKVEVMAITTQVTTVPMISPARPSGKPPAEIAGENERGEGDAIGDLHHGGDGTRHGVPPKRRRLDIARATEREIREQRQGPYTEARG